MKTTVVIPDPIFRRVKATAALEGKNLRAFLLQAVMHELEHVEAAGATRKRVRLPLVRSKHPGSLAIDADTVATALDEEDMHALA